MAVKTDSPQIAALKHTVEKRFGHPIEGRSDFSLLAMEIERITQEHIELLGLISEGRLFRIHKARRRPHTYP